MSKPHIRLLVPTTMTMGIRLVSLGLWLHIVDITEAIPQSLQLLAEVKLASLC